MENTENKVSNLVFIPEFLPVRGMTPKFFEKRIQNIEQ